MFLAYASALGHTLLDRELYLPKEWTADRERCRRAGIPVSALCYHPRWRADAARTFEAGCGCVGGRRLCLLRVALAVF